MFYLLSPETEIAKERKLRDSETSTLRGHAAGKLRYRAIPIYPYTP